MGQYQAWRNLTGDVGDPSHYGRADFGRLMERALDSVKVHKVKSNSERRKFIQDLFEAAGGRCDAAVYAFDTALQAKVEIEINLGYLKGILKNYPGPDKKDSAPEVPQGSEDSPSQPDRDDKAVRDVRPSSEQEDSPTADHLETDPASQLVAETTRSFLSSLEADPTADKDCNRCLGTGIELMIAGTPNMLQISGIKYGPCRRCHPGRDAPVGLTWPLSVTDEQVLWPMWPATMDHAEIAAQLDLIQKITEGECKKEWLKPKTAQKRQNTEGYIYFVQSGDGPIKIGWSANVESRMKELKTGNPVKLQLLGSFSGSQEVEYFCHKIFKEIAVDREWFSPDPILIDFIRRVCDGQEKTSH